MTSQQLRQKYLDFFASKGHAVIPSASLIPEHDPTVLFTTAGMHPLVPFLMGEKHAAGTRLTNVQKCLRTDDIDEVGDATHNTFFEMLGNWSLGDYWKKEAIEWSWEFLTSPDWLGLDTTKLAVSVFAGDDDAPRDDESVGIWKSLGVSDERIAYLGKDDNWWPAGGKNPGPQGPDTEMFYWTGEGSAPESFNPSDKQWVEIWNDVFMQYNKTDAGTYVPLKQRNVDTGMGLERTLAVLNGKVTVFETDLFEPVMVKIRSLTSLSDERAERIIADHLRAAVFILGDQNGVVPSNTDQGYILRRLIRRAVRYAKQLRIDPNVNLGDTFAPVIIEIYRDAYAELGRNRDRIIAELQKEEDRFEQTLDEALKIFHREKDKFLLQEYVGEIPKYEGELLSGKFAFDMFQTFGFPVEMYFEELDRMDMRYDKKGIEREFMKEFEDHQEISRKGAEQKFHGGLADHSEMSVKYHTATHLLHAALQKVLGPHALQKGSNITAERLRFDFSHPAKMTDEEKKSVDDLVNAAIACDYPVSFQEMTVEEAKEKKAMGLFEGKYGEKVKVYTVGDPNEIAVADPNGPTFSREICGGPHVEHTGVLGRFKITKEEAVSAGVRRIKAVLQ